MKTRFLKGLDKDEADKVTREYKQAQFLRERVCTILGDDIKGLLSTLKSENALDSPNYMLLQVDRLAQIKAYEKIIALLEK